MNDNDKDWRDEIKDWQIEVWHAKHYEGKGGYPYFNDENYKCVAKMKVIIPAFPHMLCEMAFSATQNIDDKWTEKVKNMEWIAEGEQRSTHVGDVITVNGEVHHCCKTGWLPPSVKQ